MICTTNHTLAFGFFSYSTRNKQKLVLNLNPEKTYSRGSVQNSQRLKPQVNDLAYFKSCGLLCWRSDLVYSNLRVHFLNTLKALHLCWAAVRNHKVVAFVGFNQDLLSQAWHVLMCDLFKVRSVHRDIYPSVNRAFWWSKQRAKLSSKAKLSTLRLNHVKKTEVVTAQCRFLRGVSASMAQPYAVLNQLSRYVNQPTWKPLRCVKTNAGDRSVNAAAPTKEKPSTKVTKNATPEINSQTQAFASATGRKLRLTHPKPTYAYERLQGKMDFSTSCLHAFMYGNNLTGFFSNPELNFKTNYNHYTGLETVSIKAKISKTVHLGYKSLNTENTTGLVKLDQNADFASKGESKGKSKRKDGTKSKAKGNPKTSFNSKGDPVFAQPGLGGGKSGLSHGDFLTPTVKVGLSPVTNFDAQAYKCQNSKLKLKHFKFVASDLLKPRLDLSRTLAAKNFKTFSMISHFVGLSLAPRFQPKHGQRHPPCFKGDSRLTSPTVVLNSPRCKSLTHGIAAIKPKTTGIVASASDSRSLGAVNDYAYRVNVVLKNQSQNLALLYLKTYKSQGTLRNQPFRPDSRGGLRPVVTRSKRNALLKPHNLKSWWPKRLYYEGGLLKNLGAEFHHFVKNPNLKQADLIFFSNPNKTPGLAKQARYLRIPTLGLMSGLRSSQDPYGSRQAPNVSFGLLGNPENGWLSFNIVTTFLSVSLKASTRSDENARDFS